MSFPKAIGRYWKSYFQTTSFHGVIHIVAEKRHWVERLLWLIIFLGSGLSSCYLILANWSRYEANPTVVTLDINYRTWDFAFPAMTFCFIDRYDTDKGEEFIKRKFEKQEGSNQEEYRAFLKVLANSSMTNLKDFKPFEQFKTIPGEELALMMAELNIKPPSDFLNFFTNVIHAAGIYLGYHSTVIEGGLCYSINSIYTGLLPPSGTNATIVSRMDIINCSYFVMPCGVLSKNFWNDIRYNFHSPYEVPDSQSQWYTESVDTRLTYLELQSQSETRELALKQRKCFMDSDNDGPSTSFYSFSICKMNCRRQYAMSLCRCVPHFYKKAVDQPICTVEGLICLSEHMENLIDLEYKNESKLDCPCIPTCWQTEYFRTEESQPIGTIFGRKEVGVAWGIGVISKVKYTREVLFAFQDLLVSFGGIAGLFLGCSILSFVELGYFLTLRLIRFIYNFIQKQKQKPKQKQPVQRAQLHSNPDYFKKYYN